MVGSGPRRLALFAALGASTAWSEPAAADAEACARSGEAAQSLRSTNHLQQARTELVACAQDACPIYIRQDCDRWLHEVDAIMPSIVVRARGEDGADLLEGNVAIDGVAAGSLGLPIALDPGPHTVKFRDRGRTRSSEQRILVAVGEQNRVVVLTAAAAERPAPPKPAVEDESDRRQPGTLPWVLGGAGIVSVGVFAGLQLSAKSQYDDLRGTCGHACAPSDVDPVRTKVTISAVALAVGVVALGAAAWVWLSAPSSQSRSSTTSSNRTSVAGAGAL